MHKKEAEIRKMLLLNLFALLFSVLGLTTEFNEEEYYDEGYDPTMQTDHVVQKPKPNWMDIESQTV